MTLHILNPFYLLKFCITKEQFNDLLRSANINLYLLLQFDRHL